jgi:hypothetical protein
MMAARRLVTKLGLLALSVAWTLPASAGSITENWAITGAGFSGSGQVTFATTGSPGVDEVTAMTGSFSTTAGGGFSGAVSLVPGSYSVTLPTVDPIGTFDNLLYLTGSPPDCAASPAGSSSILDVCGIEFSVAGGYEANIYGDTGPSGYLLDDGVASSGVFYDIKVSASFSLSAIPEPAALELLPFGVLALAAMRRRGNV